MEISSEKTTLKAHYLIILLFVEKKLKKIVCLIKNIGLRHLIIFYISIFSCFGLFAQGEMVQTVDSLKIKRIDSLKKFIVSEFYKRNYDKTIEYGELAITLSESASYYNVYNNISSFLGNAYLAIDDSLKAKKIFNRSIELAYKEQDTTWILAAEIDLANLFALRKEPSSRRKSIKLYQNILPLAETANLEDKLLVLNSNIAEMYLKLNQPDSAEKYITQTTKYINDSTFVGFKGSYRLNKGVFNNQKGNYKQAKIDLEESYSIFEEIDYLDGKIDIYIALVENAYLRGNYKEAFEAQQKLDLLEKEKFEVDKVEAVQTVTTKFKVEEMKKQLEEEKLFNEISKAEAKREATLFWVKIASGILLIFSISIAISYYRRKKLVVDLTAKNKQYLAEKERSEELMRAKSVLFSNITHELRTPMYGIIGISNMLSENKLFKSEKGHLKSLKFSADYLLSLINNILHFNKLESNEPDAIKISAFDIRNLVYNAVESSKFLSEEHPNKYIVTIDDSIPNIIEGDEIKISQILINLLSNASKFTNDGTIEISLEEINRTSEKIEIGFIIKDTGVGIDEKTLSTIYNKYAQTGTGQHFMGTGLGLPIVKKLVEQLGGILNLKSVIGKGTTIHFALEYGMSKKAHLDEIANADLNQILNDFNVLIIDDNKINQLVTGKFIERHGATSKTASSGQEGIELLKAETFDIILMDINMPEMNGFETTKIIRSFNQDIPIIALTAVEKEKVVGDHSFNLMNDIIIKPYSNEKFINIILTNAAPKH